MWHVLLDKTLASTGERVNVGHHASWAMSDSKVAPQQFLSPAVDNVDLAVVIWDLFHGAAVANPVKHRAPKKFLVF